MRGMRSWYGARTSIPFFVGFALAACGGGDGPPLDPEPDAASPPPRACPDVAFEPNDTPQTAYPTGVGDGIPGVTYQMLSICPASDVDYFSIRPTTTMTVVTKAVSAGAATLSLEALNAIGTPIGSGTRVGNEVSLVLANVPTGIYYVRVTGGGTELSYDLTISAAGI